MRTLSGKKIFDHRSGSPYNEYTYDSIDRLTAVTYLDSDTEGFVMDDLGNRDGSYNSGDTNIAEYAYDTQGRRIRVYDAVSDATTLYYYSDNWQVLADYNGSGVQQAYYIFGNYIDEVLLMNRGGSDKYYLHDHLYSPVALLDDDGAVLERYEYDAYGKVTVWNAAFTNTYTTSQYGNPYAFTGRELDTLDAGNCTLMHYRARTYDTQTGRFMQRDPHGINPAGGEINAFSIENQYADGVNIYQYAVSNPLYGGDSYGLWGPEVHYTNTERWARIVGYRKGNCSEIIAKACDGVDGIKGGKSPWPYVGNASYHFDTDSSGMTLIPGMRSMLVDQHLTEAIRILDTQGYSGVHTALQQIGIALHPLQDSFSHNNSHNSEMPRYHAPKSWCRYQHGYPANKLSPWYGFCAAQERINRNWNDEHRPDRISLWVSDHSETRRATQSVLESFLSNPHVRCKCSKNY